jgi:hypothetical protein
VPTDGGLDSAGLDELLANTRRALESVRGARPAGGDAPVGVGAAAGAQVRVTAAAPGELTGLEIDPRLLRLPAAELAAHVVDAVNAALADLRAKAVEAATPVDVDRLGSQLADLHNESIRQMQRFTSAITGAVDQIRGRGQ